LCKFYPKYFLFKSVLKEVTLKNISEAKENEKKIINKIFEKNDAEIFPNELMKQLSDVKNNKSLFVHNYRQKQYLNLSYTKLYHTLINIFEIIPLIQNHQIGKKFANKK
jgi:hypothetical protein